MFANILESIKTYARPQICTEQIQLTIDPLSISGDPPSTSGSGLDIQIIVSDYQSTATVMSSPNIIAGPLMVVTPPGGDSATDSRMIANILLANRIIPHWRVENRRTPHRRSANIHTSSYIHFPH